MWCPPDSLFDVVGRHCSCLIICQEPLVWKNHCLKRHGGILQTPIVPYDSNVVSVQSTSAAVSKSTRSSCCSLSPNVKKVVLPWLWTETKPKRTVAYHLSSAKASATFRNEHKHVFQIIAYCWLHLQNSPKQFIQSSAGYDKNSSLLASAIVIWLQLLLGYDLQIGCDCVG